MPLTDREFGTPRLAPAPLGTYHPCAGFHCHWTCTLPFQTLLPAQPPGGIPNWPKLCCHPLKIYSPGGSIWLAVLDLVFVRWGDNCLLGLQSGGDIFPIMILLCICVCVLRCVWLWNPMDYSPPGSSLHGILQARILEWVVISFSKRSSRPRGWTMSPALHTNSLPLHHGNWS